VKTKDFTCAVVTMIFEVFFMLVGWTIYFSFIASGVGLSPCTAATSGLLYQPQMRGEVIVEQLVE
jgi:hypothetical protein